MVKFVSGDFFEYEADIRINTVNCVGVMGAGVALEFKNRYPEMFKAYVKVCKNGEIAPDNPYIWEECDLFSRCIIINLPTKIHWKNPSEYQYIEANLEWLSNYLKEKSSDTTVTLPALGCGHGGLDWNIVKGMIIHYLDDLTVTILSFEPSSSNNKWDNPHMKINSNIDIIYPQDSYYPKTSINNSHELYCKGNKKLLKEKKLTIICSNTITDKERAAIFNILEELKNNTFTVILGLNNKSQIALAKEILQLGFHVIIILPYGIKKLKKDDDWNEYKERLLFISYSKPNQEFKKYEYINSLKFRLKIANVVLYCCDNIDNIRKNKKYFTNCINMFYVNFWSEKINEFEELNAYRIGINARTKKPLLSKLISILS